MIRFAQRVCPVCGEGLFADQHNRIIKCGSRAGCSYVEELQDEERHRLSVREIKRKERHEQSNDSKLHR